MHGIYVNRDITLIGPISEDGNKVFSSLTYYMLMPFAVLGDFDPVSPVWGAASWGIIGLVLLWLYLHQKEGKTSLRLLLTASLGVVWAPLVLTSRWAWNPNLIPFWVILSLMLLKGKRWWSKFLAGLALGMTIHHHYLSIFAVGAFAVLHTMYSLKGQALKVQGLALKKFLPLMAGISLSVLPFVLFDLTHPPGLFLSRVLYFNYLGGEGGLGRESLLGIFRGFIEYVGRYGELGKLGILGGLLSISTVILLSNDVWRRNKEALLYGLTWVFHLVGLGLVAVVYDHYFLPAIIFFLAWLFVQRNGWRQQLSYLILVLLIFASVLSLPSFVTEKNWESDIRSTKKIVEIVEQDIVTNKLINPNVAVLTSPDPNIYGRKYRDLMLVRGNVETRSKDEYGISDNLFVVTYGEEDEVRRDPAAEMNGFREGVVKGEWEIEGSQWRVFRFDRY
jgi:hypothetical protein